MDNSEDFPVLLLRLTNQLFVDWVNQGLETGNFKNSAFLSFILCLLRESVRHGKEKRRVKKWWCGKWEKGLDRSGLPGGIFCFFLFSLSFLLIWAHFSFLFLPGRLPYGARSNLDVTYSIISSSLPVISALKFNHMKLRSSSLWISLSFFVSLFFYLISHCVWSLFTFHEYAGIRTCNEFQLKMLIVKFEEVKTF